jgi:hypothetical protein
VKNHLWVGTSHDRVELAHFEEVLGSQFDFLRGLALHSVSPAFTIAFLCLLVAQSRTQEQEISE